MIMSEHPAVSPSLDKEMYIVKFICLPILCHCQQSVNTSNSPPTCTNQPIRYLLIACACCKQQPQPRESCFIIC